MPVDFVSFYLKKFRFILAEILLNMLQTHENYCSASEFRYPSDVRHSYFMTVLKLLYYDLHWGDEIHWLSSSTSTKTGPSTDGFNSGHPNIKWIKTSSK